MVVSVCIESMPRIKQFVLNLRGAISDFAGAREKCVLLSPITKGNNIGRRKAVQHHDIVNIHIIADVMDGRLRGRVCRCVGSTAWGGIRLPDASGAL